MDLIRDNRLRALLYSLVPKRRTLEDLFVEIVGERIDVEAGVRQSTSGRQHLFRASNSMSAVIAMWSARVSLPTVGNGGSERHAPQREIATRN